MKHATARALVAGDGGGTPGGQSSGSSDRRDGTLDRYVRLQIIPPCDHDTAAGFPALATATIGKPWGRLTPLRLLDVLIWSLRGPRKDAVGALLVARSAGGREPWLTAG